MRRRVYLQFAILFAITILCWWRPLTETLSLALNDDEYTHILIIVPISLFFIFLRRKKLSASISKNGVVLSLTLFVLAVLFYLLAIKAHLPIDVSLTISIATLIVAWIGSFIFCFGFDTFRTFLFPLLFLFWLVPWPLSFLNTAISFLQQTSATAVNWMFEIFGIPVLRSGVILSIPGLTIEVARECSSIRSSLILLISSMVLAQLFLRTKWRKTLVILIAVPLSVVKNAVRIFTLSMLGIHVNRGFLTGKLHHQGGAVFYAGALVALFLIVYIFQKMEIRSAGSVSMATGV